MKRFMAFYLMIIFLLMAHTQGNAAISDVFHKQGNDRGICPLAPDHLLPYRADKQSDLQNADSLAQLKKTGLFTDPRDGQTYRWIEIEGQIWMMENLRYLPSVGSLPRVSRTRPQYNVYGYRGTSVSEAKATDNYKIYGVLYNWPAAMKGDGMRDACPPGWHLPTDEEMDLMPDLRTPLGGKRGILGGFSLMGKNGYWWSATDYTVTRAWARGMNHRNKNIDHGLSDKARGFSIRCLSYGAIEKTNIQYVYMGDDTHESQPLPWIDIRDKRSVHLGLMLGANMIGFQMISQADIQTHGFEQIRPVSDKGFQIGLVANLRLNKSFDLRFIPSILYSGASMAGGRSVEYTHFSGHSGLGENKVQGVLLASYLELPVHVRYSFLRLGNSRVFITGGPKYTYALNKPDMVNLSYDPKSIYNHLSRHDIYLEPGLGFEYHFPKFSFGMEVKASFGMRNLLQAPGTMGTQYYSAIEQLRSRAILVSFYFE